MSNEQVDPDVRKALLSQFDLDEKDPLDEEERSLSDDASTPEVVVPTPVPTGEEMYEARGDSPSVDSMLQEVLNYETPGEVEDDVREQLNRTHIDEDIIKNMLEN